MQDIDFLPAEFKRRRTNRHERSWRIVVVVAAFGLLFAAGMAQSRTKRQIEACVALMKPERMILDARQSQLVDLREQLAQSEAQAELLTYMEHPWPKTQLLAAVLQDLPDTIVYHRICIACDRQESQAVRTRRSEAEEDDLAKLEPALRDLRLLQNEFDSAVVAITLEGVTTDGIELHRYLARLNAVPLLDKVELHSLESTNDDTAARFRFEAQLTVRQGFGQPRGPRGLSRQLAGTSPVTNLPPSEPNQR